MQVNMQSPRMGHFVVVPSPSYPRNDPQMPTVSGLLTHAQTAVERAACALDDLRTRVDATSDQMSATHRLQAEQALQDLHNRHDNLVHLYENMIDAPEESRSALWGRFFACYDDCLEGLREFSCSLGTKSPR